ncbi:MAG: HD domain-containing protein [bacterium]|nr:HD domain-containing protein [bacterium]
MEMHMITLSQLQRSCPCFQIGDITFVADRDPDHRRIEKFGVWLSQQPWFQPLRCLSKGQTSENSVMLGTNCLHDLREVYFGTPRKSPPEWLKTIPKPMQHWLDRQWWLIEADPHAILPCIAHSGFGIVATCDGLIQATDSVFGLSRLAHISQLASLHSPVVTNRITNEFPMKFGHTRFQHSLEVTAYGMLIGYRCELSANDMALLEVATESHDALTPAGGDSLKSIDPEAFDEDQNFPKLFKSPGWARLRDHFEFSEAKLAQTILGEGILGGILDAADKLAYTGTDTREFLGRNWPRGFVWEEFEDSYEGIQSILRNDPCPCSVWECTKRIGDELVFTDQDRLANFLRLRAFMFNILYANASARFLEAGLMAAVTKILYQEGTLTGEKLLSMTDDQLFSLLNASMGSWAIVSLPSLLNKGTPQVELFTTFQEALDFERSVVVDSPETMTAFEKAPPPPTKCLSTFKVKKGKKVVPFNVAQPFASWEIEKVAHDPKPFRVFVYQLPEICPNKDMQKRLLASRNQRIA